MIVKPSLVSSLELNELRSFLGPKTDALEVLLRLWGYCEERKTNWHKDASDQISRLVGWRGDPDVLVDALVETGFVVRQLHPKTRAPILILHNWSKYNNTLVLNWKKGDSRKPTAAREDWDSRIVKEAADRAADEAADRSADIATDGATAGGEWKGRERKREGAGAGAGSEPDPEGAGADGSGGDDSPARSVWRRLLELSDPELGRLTFEQFLIATRNHPRSGWDTADGQRELAEAAILAGPIDSPGRWFDYALSRREQGSTAGAGSGTGPKKKGETGWFTGLSQ